MFVQDKNQNPSAVISITKRKIAHKINSNRHKNLRLAIDTCLLAINNVISIRSSKSKLIQEKPLVKKDNSSEKLINEMNHFNHFLKKKHNIIICCDDTFLF